MTKRYNGGAFLGEFIAPIISGILSEKYGYDRAFSIMGLITISFSICYLPIFYIKVERIQDDVKNDLDS